MGSTITTGRVAAGVRVSDGRTFFLLFEQTCCSNVFPRTPTLSCISTGYLPSTLNCIFDMASSCEGGMLRTPSGRLTPEGYIDTWLKQLTEPLIVECTTVRIEFNSGSGQMLTPEQLDRAVDLLGDFGFPKQAYQLRNTHSVDLNLALEAEALLALQDGLPLDTWQLIDRNIVDHRMGQRDHALGYVTEPTKTVAAIRPVALKLNTEVRLLQDAHGKWRCGGWQYSLVGRHIRDLWRTELAYPGHHRRRIGTYREALETAPMAPTGLIVEISDLETDDGHTLQRIQMLREMVGSREAVFRVPVNSETEYALANLPSACAEWLMPGNDEPMAVKQATLAV